MSVNKSEIRRNRTSQVARWNPSLKAVDTPNGHRGRSQKGCFGGKGVVNAERHNA